MLGAVAGTLAILPHMAASIAGLAALLHASALAFQIVKYLGAAYLLYMAWEVLRSGGALELTAETQPRSAGRILLDGMLIGLLNPKLSLFFLAFLPQFAPADAPGATAHMLMLAGVFMALTLVVFIGYAAFASAARWRRSSSSDALRRSDAVSVLSTARWNKAAARSLRASLALIDWASIMRPTSAEPAGPVSRFAPPASGAVRSLNAAVPTSARHRATVPAISRVRSIGRGAGAGSSWRARRGLVGSKVETPEWGGGDSRTPRSCVIARIADAEVVRGVGVEQRSLRVCNNNAT